MEEINLKYKPQKPSTKHHYLPKFYLNGFTNEKGLFCVYDKVEQKFHINQKPLNWFFVKHLNSFRKENNLIFTLEEPYFSHLDSRLATVIKKVRQTSLQEHPDIHVNDRIDTLMFISTLFWRSPFTDNIFKEMINKLGFNNPYFGFQVDGKNVIDKEIIDVINDIINSQDNIRLFKHMIPLSDGAILEFVKLLDKWNLFHLQHGNINTLIGDNPFIVKNYNLKYDNVLDQVIIPLSSDKILALVDESPSFMDKSLYALINATILHQSNRHVACASEEHLRITVEFYNKVTQTLPTDKLSDAVFAVMKKQSKFISHEEYIKSYFSEIRKN